MKKRFKVVKYHKENKWVAYYGDVKVISRQSRDAAIFALGKRVEFLRWEGFAH